jgi:hypothetical protein
MGTKKKSGGHGTILARSHGDGSVAVAPPDRRPASVPAHQEPVLDNHHELCLALDGEVTRTTSRYNAETATPRHRSNLASLATYFRSCNS